MSGAHPPPNQPPGAPAQGAAGDPSMEDILASIRRILSEDEPAAAPEVPGAAVPPLALSLPPADDVLVLDPSMLVAEPKPAPARAPSPAPFPAPSPAAGGLVAPETQAAVASTMGGLLRTLGDHTPIYRGGPTLEDIVREEMRPLLKQWLDTHLQALVERQVRAEIERIVGRAVS